MMKNLTTAIMLTLSTFAISQRTEKKIWKENTPGYELQIASRHYYTGNALVAGGSLLYVVGSIYYFNSNYNNNYYVDPNSGNYYQQKESGSGWKALTYIGVGAMIVGMGYMIESHSHIGRAGILLDERGVGVSIPIK